MCQKCKFSRINHNESIFVLPQRQGEVFHSGKGQELHQNFSVIYQKSILASPRNMNRRFVEDLILYECKYEPSWAKLGSALARLMLSLIQVFVFGTGLLGDV